MKKRLKIIGTVLTEEIFEIVKVKVITKPWNFLPSFCRATKNCFFMINRLMESKKERNKERKKEKKRNKEIKKERKKEKRKKERKKERKNIMKERKKKERKKEERKERKNVHFS